MYKDRIDLAVTPEDHTAVDTALLAIEQKYNFTQSLPVGDRKSLYKLGIDKEAFANQILDLAKANLDLLPKGIDLAKIERDKTAREALLPRLQRMRQMVERHITRGLRVVEPPVGVLLDDDRTFALRIFCHSPP